MKVALICNPGAGKGVEADGTAEILRRHGADVVEVADGPDGVTGTDVERLVVVSGDGMLGAVAALAGRLGVPLAVVPGGTANDFARTMELPTDTDEAAELAAAGRQTRALELASMDGRPFVNVASAGLAPAAARRALPLKAWLGPLAYTWGAAVAGLRERPIACRAVVDGEEAFEGEAWQITVAATGAFGGGSGIDHANPQDGRLDLVVVPAEGRRALVGVGLAMRRGTIAGRPGVTHRRGDDITLHIPPGTAFNVDGEIVEAGAQAVFSARAGAFSLVRA